MSLLVTGGGDNLFLEPDRIAAETLFRLTDALIFPRLAGRPRRYEKYFETMQGNKVSVKRPFRAGVTKGRVANTAVPMIDEVVELWLDQRWHFRLDATDEDFTLDLNDFSDRYLATGCEELAYKYNIMGANEVGKALFYAYGTPGSGATTQHALKTRAAMTKVAIPDNQMVYLVCDPDEIANLSHDVKEVNVPAMASSAIRHHYRGMIADMHLFGTNFIPHLHVPNQASFTPLVQAVPTPGTKTLSVKGVGNQAGRNFVNKGNIITIDGVGEIHPRGDRQRTGRPAQFVVTADVPASAGTVSVPVYPEFNAGPGATIQTQARRMDGADGATSNVDKRWFQTCTAMPAVDAPVRILGAGSAAAKDAYFSQGLAFEQTALEFFHVRLKKLKAVNWSAQKIDPKTMVAVSLNKGFNIETMEEITRADIMFGTKCIYPEVGMRWLLASVQ